MNNRDEDLNDLMSMVPERDELSAYKNQAKSDILMDAPSGGGASIALVWFTLVLVLIASGVSGYLYMELTKSNDRIAQLEMRLSEAGESMDQSSATLGLKLKEVTQKTNELWDQMDKLWASAWRRNQSDIAGLRDDIKALNKKSTDVSSSLAALKKVTDDVPDLEKRVASLSGMKADIDKALATANGMKSSLSKMEISVAKVEGAQSAIAKRVDTNEQWVESINAYRKQVNRRLEDLSKTISPTATTSPSLN